MIAGVLLSHERNRDQEFRRALPLSCIGQFGTKLSLLSIRFQRENYVGWRAEDSG